MSQHDLIVDNASGAVARSDINAALQALGTLQAGATEPSTTYARQLWADTTTLLLKQRNAANNGWMIRGTIAETRVLSRSSNTIITAADFGKTFVCTGSFTQTFSPAANLADGFMCYIRNDGSGTVTLDPDASEQINGANTVALAPGKDTVLFCNGSAFYAFGAGGVQAAAVNAFTAKNTFSAGLFTKILVKTADYTVTEADSGAIIFADTVGGNITITLPDGVSASLRVKVFKVSTAHTLAISRQATGVLYVAERAPTAVNTFGITAKGSGVECVGDGTDYWVFQLGAKASGFQVFTADGTFNVPAGITSLLVMAIGGGGGGGGGGSSNSNTTKGGGGTGGVSGDRVLSVVSPSAAEAIAVTIGAGGAAGSAGADGTDGTDTLFGGYITAVGGPAGQSSAINITASTSSFPGGNGHGDRGGRGGRRTDSGSGYAGDDGVGRGSGGGGGAGGANGAGGNGGSGKAGMVAVWY